MPYKIQTEREKSRTIFIAKSLDFVNLTFVEMIIPRATALSLIRKTFYFKLANLIMQIDTTD